MKAARILGVFFSLIFSIILLSACDSYVQKRSDSNDAFAQTSATDDLTLSEHSDVGEGTAPETITLTWVVWDWDAIVYYQPLIDSYTEINPHVTINYIDLGAIDYNTVLGIQLAGAADYDVITIKDVPGYADLVRHGHLEPLSRFAAEAGIDTDAFGGLVEELTVNDEFYALPFRSDFWVVFYNKRLFDRAGVPYPNNEMTLEDFDRIARQMTDGSGSDKIYGTHYHTWRSTVQLFGILDGQNTIVDGNYEFLRPIYEIVLNQQRDGIIMDFATLRVTASHYSGLWQSEQIAMMNMGTWFIPTAIMRIENGESLADEWGITRYPVPAGTAHGTTLGTITSVAVSSSSARKDAALDFVKFISGPQGAEILANLGQFPAIMDDKSINLIASMPGFPPDQQSRDALQSTKIYLEMPMHERSGDIEVVLNEVHNEILLYTITIDEGITVMNERVREIIG